MTTTTSAATSAASATTTATETETLWVTVYAGGSEYLMQGQVAQRGNGVFIRGEANAHRAEVLVEKWFPELSPGRAKVLVELITRPKGCYNLPV